MAAIDARVAFQPEQSFGLQSSGCASVRVVGWCGSGTDPNGM